MREIFSLRSDVVQTTMKIFIFQALLLIFVTLTQGKSESDYISAHQTNGNASAQDNRNFCDTRTCIKDAQRILKWMNRKVDYCKSFYNFTCGSFLAYVSNYHFHGVAQFGDNRFFI